MKQVTSLRGEVSDIGVKSEVIDVLWDFVGILYTAGNLYYVLLISLSNIREELFFDE